MAEAFRSPKRIKSDQKRLNNRLNPAPGRSQALTNRIRRRLTQVSEVIEKWLDYTDYKPVYGWLPHRFVITAKDDEWMADLFAAYKDSKQIDSDGLLWGYHDQRIKATNNITAITWYRNESGQEALISKRIYSPLKCEQWGALPLTLAQWRIVAPAMIKSRQLWQWVFALRHYHNDPTFQLGGFMGWHLSLCNKTTNREQMNEQGYLKDAEPLDPAEGSEVRQWTGHIIYKHITDEFLAEENCQQDTQFQQ